MRKMMEIWSDKFGQDLIEYALMAAFVAVAAGAIMPGVSRNIGMIFAKISHSRCVADAENIVDKHACQVELDKRKKEYGYEVQNGK